MALTTSSTDPAVEPMDQDPMSLERGRAEKRRASKEVTDEFQTEEEKKRQRIGDGPLDYLEMEDALMSKLEDAEKKTVHVANYMPMMTCEDGVGISYLKKGKAAMLSEAIECTNVGQLRDRLDVQLNQCFYLSWWNPLVCRWPPAGMTLQGCVPALGRMSANPFRLWK